MGWRRAGHRLPLPPPPSLLPQLLQLAGRRSMHGATSRRWREAISRGAGGAGPVPARTCSTSAAMSPSPRSREAAADCGSPPSAAARPQQRQSDTRTSAARRGTGFWRMETLIELMIMRSQMRNEAWVYSRPATAAALPLPPCSHPTQRPMRSSLSARLSFVTRRSQHNAQQSHLRSWSAP